MLKQFFLVVVFSVFAQSAFAAKIVSLNLQGVLANADYTQGKFKALEKSASYSKVRAQYDALAADLQALQKDAKSKSLTWSVDQKTENQKKQQFIVQDLQLAQKKLQTEQKVVNDMVTRELQPHLTKAIEQIIASDGIDMIIDRQAVLHTNEKNDITKKVLKVVNKLAKSK